MKGPDLLVILLFSCVLPPQGWAAEQPAPDTEAEQPEPEVLTVATWGGAYEDSQRRAYFEPFTRATGIAIETVPYDGGIRPLKRHLAGGEVTWDVIDMIESDADVACAQELLEPIEPDILLPTPDGTSAQEDFMKGAIQPCFITHLVFSTVIAYNDEAFPGEKPDSVEDFFDLETFPGKRALRLSPTGLFEWALLSLSVPPEQVYDLLSTPRGMELASERLDSIRDSIIWWQNGEEPALLLASGQATMATGYNGRFFHARVMDDVPISVIWDGQLTGFNSWAIPRGTAQTEQAQAFIAFATRTDRMAAHANLISYGPTRDSARKRIGLHTDNRVAMQPHMPTAPGHMDHALMRDHRWYSKTVDLRERWFKAWLSEKDETP
ncbi:ABC transporter substrate-binding protein [Marinobacter sp. chi1]|uniref:ABC transporter substrate-binding protein n=1 Tax=Marinobacter suaedae TaxID=3057675 RepID=A0ABT8VZI1_9GAMM|nr:ABC transporter substrate-binding protein [Marinobacter sp. chi1]MDO3721407.1 ABC transporter substrate-binding protein [Marinobacter sp. chi1]